MDNFWSAIAPIWGIIGVVIGSVINELFRRRNRREIFASKIFDKRLAAYEELVGKIEQGGRVALEVINSEELTFTERHEMTSEVIHSIIDHVQKHRLYLDEDLTVHCMALFMGIEDIYGASPDDQEKLKEHYFNKKNEALRMILEDSGVAEVNKLFKSINKPKIDGVLIDYFRLQKRKAAKNK